MTEIRRILVPTDFSEAAINAMAYGMWVADRTNASIHVVHVVFPGTGELDVPVVSASETKRRVESAEQAIDAFIETGRARLAKHFTVKKDIPVTSEIRVGAPISELNAILKSEEVELIVAGTRAKHNAIDDIFGSVANSIVRKAVAPVIIVPESNQNFRLNDICYATTLDESDPYFIWKTRQLFRSFGPQIHIVHVDPPHRNSGDITMHELDAMLSERKSHQDITLNRLEGDDVVEELQKFVEKRELDMIVMRTTHRNILQRLVHESVTRKMSLHSQVPVCILKTAEY